MTQQESDIFKLDHKVDEHYGSQYKDITHCSVIVIKYLMSKY